MRTKMRAIWQKITDTKKLDDDTMAELDKAIAEFQQAYASQKQSAQPG
jgi:hypothetical protein